MIKSFEQEEIASLSATTRGMVVSSLMRILESAGIKETYMIVNQESTPWIRGAGYRCRSVESAEAAVLAFVAGWKWANQENAERMKRSDLARRAARIGAAKRRRAAKKAGVR